MDPILFIDAGILDLIGGDFLFFIFFSSKRKKSRMMRMIIQYSRVYVVWLIYVINVRITNCTSLLCESIIKIHQVGITLTIKHKRNNFQEKPHPLAKST